MKNQMFLSSLCIWYWFFIYKSDDGYWFVLEHLAGGVAFFGVPFLGVGFFSAAFSFKAAIFSGKVITWRPSKGSTVYARTKSYHFGPEFSLSETHLKKRVSYPEICYVSYPGYCRNFENDDITPYWIAKYLSYTNS